MLCQETEQFLLRETLSGFLVSLKKAKKMSGILTQVIVCETITSGHQTT